MSLLEKIRNKKSALSQYSDSYGYFIYPKLEGHIKNRMFFNGNEVITWSNNDYLGLTSDERVIEVESEAVRQYGISYPSGSRLLSANTESHELLEYELTKLIGKDSMILNLAYMGMVSIIQSLLDRHDIIIYDQEAHACIQDGAKQHIGNRFSFKHNDIQHLEIQLSKAKKLSINNSGQILLVVDGVYSMKGDIAKLKEIIELKKYYDFTLLVDDAHGFLVFNENSSPGHLDLMDNIDIYISSFGKALGTLGGVVASNKDYINYFKYNLRSQIFARSLSIINVISVLFKLELLKAENYNRREKLWSNTNALQSGLKELGFDIGNTQGPITPIYIHADTDYAATIVRSLREEHKIFCSGVVYPVIPKNQILLRLIPTSLHTKEDIELTINAFATIKEDISEMYVQ